MPSAPSTGRTIFRQTRDDLVKMPRQLASDSNRLGSVAEVSLGRVGGPLVRSTTGATVTRTMDGWATHLGLFDQMTKPLKLIDRSPRPIAQTRPQRLLDEPSHITGVDTLMKLIDRSPKPIAQTRPQRLLDEPSHITGVDTLMKLIDRSPKPIAQTRPRVSGIDAIAKTLKLIERANCIWAPERIGTTSVATGMTGLHPVATGEMPGSLRFITDPHSPPGIRTLTDGFRLAGPKDDATMLRFPLDRVLGLPVARLVRDLAVWAESDDFEPAAAAAALPISSDPDAVRLALTWLFEYACRYLTEGRRAALVAFIGMAWLMVDAENPVAKCVVLVGGAWTVKAAR